MQLFIFLVYAFKMVFQLERYDLATVIVLMLEELAAAHETTL